jgi:hypothetical protein
LKDMEDPVAYMAGTGADVLSLPSASG